MSVLKSIKKIVRVESKLRAIRINMIREELGSTMSRKKINKILMEDLKKDLGIEDNGVKEKKELVEKWM